ncbi:sugar ABC transporter substrate-binding protein [Neobacillus cucumis]|uniref:sugar ABC transporter substrate-binding protein n=1 Tax=Neobacillus cucumis TaxID=1740721 RepID=UPI00203CE1A6|nr:sugar ABC transporter substrate-binding protein [Neobacillus cucumis]MCM3729198.1 sugar ABC transporter substrate-binding protein [Neobacillus cucumis]
MLKKTRILLLIGGAFLIILIGSYLNKKDNKPKVVVVLKTLNTKEQYWKIIESGAKKAFKDFKIDGVVVAPNHEVKDQVDLLKNILKQKPEALLIAPIQQSTTIPILEKYKKRHIPVLIVDTHIDWNGQTSYIGTDNYLLGKTSGELLGSMLQPGDQVALIHPTVVNGDMVDRLKGARDVLEAAGIKIIAELPADNQSGEVKKALNNIVQTFPNIKGVFAATDMVAIGTLKELKEKGMPIPVVGTDGNMNMVQEVEEGNNSATIAQNPFDMGYLSVVQAIKAINGKPVEKRIDTGIDIIDQENAKRKIDFLTSNLK